jgi:hypothetical protein
MRGSRKSNLLHAEAIREGCAEQGMPGKSALFD